MWRWKNKGIRKTLEYEGNEQRVNLIVETDSLSMLLYPLRRTWWALVMYICLRITRQPASPRYAFMMGKRVRNQWFCLHQMFEKYPRESDKPVLSFFFGARFMLSPAKMDTKAYTTPRFYALIF